VSTLKEICLVTGASADEMLGLVDAARLPRVADVESRYQVPPEIRRVIRRVTRLEHADLRFVSLLAERLTRARKRGS